MLKSLTVLLALALALTAASASAQQKDAAGEKQLIATGQTIDASADKAGSARVTTRIVEQWSGTKFTFEKGGTPRELTAKDVQGYRAKGLGYGEISILLALTARQDSTTPLSVNEILAMRQTEKMGWGNVAKRLGYKNLGEVQKAVKATDASVRREAADAKPEKTAKAEKADRPEKVEKVEKVERPERVEKMDRPERVERVERKTK
jgi:hypothetical protein